MSGIVYSPKSFLYRAVLLALCTGAVLFNALAELFADVVTNIEGAHLRVELKTLDVAGEFRLTLTSLLRSKEVNAQVFVIEDPMRLVVDIPGFKASRADNLLFNNRQLSGMRFGVHPDKVRLVVDVKGLQPPSYTVTSARNRRAITVDFNFSGKAQEFVSAFDLPEHERGRPPDAPTIITSGSQGSGHSRGGDLLRGVQPEGLQVVNPNNNEGNRVASLRGEGGGGRAVVKRILFEREEKGEYGLLAIKVDGLSRYSLTVKRSNIYLLKLEQAVLAGDFLLLPLFPPDSFAGIETVIAKQAAGSVVLEIYIEEGVRLAPYRSSGELYIKVFR